MFALALGADTTASALTPARPEGLACSYHRANRSLRRGAPAAGVY